MSVPDKIAQLKKEAAIKAVEYIQSGMIVGLGTGSTVQFALEEIARKLNTGELEHITGIPTSIRTRNESTRLGIPLTTLDEHPEIDLTIDGADEVDANLNLIKGGGGAHLHEKIIAQASKTFIVIVDEGKISYKLGEKFYVPLEVIPAALKTERLYIERLGAKVTQRMNKNGKPFRSDENNYIIDGHFGPIDNPAELAIKLNSRAGIVEHGLFIDMANRVVVAGKEGVYFKVKSKK